MQNIKDILTTVIGIGFLIFTAVQQYLATLQPDGAINWFQLLVAVAVAIDAPILEPKNRRSVVPCVFRGDD